MNPDIADKYLFRQKYFDQTLVDPLALGILIVMGITLLFVPRKYALWPFIIVSSFLTQAQRVSIFTLDFTFLRLMVVFGIIRLLMNDEFRGFVWNTLDKLVIAFMSVRTIWALAGLSHTGSFVGMLGESMDMLGMYFFFRCVVRDFDDLKSATYGFIVVSIPIAIAFIYESQALRNPFHFLGGVADVTRARDGKLRCMGAYSHPILAGCYWAALLPYMGAVIKQRGSIKIMPIIGVGCAGIIIVLSGSSSPIAGAGLAFIGGCLFIFRRHMRLIRWGTFAILVMAQLFMAKGVAHLLARTDLTGGSTGYYRFQLISQFIAHFKDWFIRGGTTSNWAVPQYDIVNYYVWLGLNGGLLFVVLLALIIIFAYKNVGRLIRSVQGNSETELMAWAVGVAVFVHMMTFLAVTYYGQIIMIWFFALAATSVRSKMGVRQAFPSMYGRRHQDPLARLANRPIAYPQPPRLANG